MLDTNFVQSCYFPGSIALQLDHRVYLGHKSNCCFLSKITAKNLFAYLKMYNFRFICLQKVQQLRLSLEQVELIIFFLTLKILFYETSSKLRVGLDKLILQKTPLCKIIYSNSFETSNILPKAIQFLLIKPFPIQPTKHLIST